jgi:hypothetical protein
LDRKLGGPQIWSGSGDKRNNSLPLPGIEVRVAEIRNIIGNYIEGLSLTFVNSYVTTKLAFLS